MTATGTTPKTRHNEPLCAAVAGSCVRGIGMNDGITTLLEREAKAGFPRFRGMQLRGQIPVSETTLNELIRHGNVAAGLRLEVDVSNRIIARSGVLRVTAILADVLELGASPKITLELTSRLVAWLLRLVVTMPGLSVHGRHVTIDLDRFEAFREYREAWAHVRSVRMTTSPRTLHVQFEFVVG